MKKERLYETLKILLKYGEDKGYELEDLVEKGYLDSDFAPRKVIESKLYVEHRLGRDIEVYNTFYDMICELDRKYPLVYNKGDKIMVMYEGNEYIIYYMKGKNIQYERYRISGEGKYA